MPRAEVRARLIGVLVGAIVGGAGRAVVTALHLSPSTQGTALILLTSAVAGMLIGALAGLAGSPLAGAVLGVAVSGLLYLFTLPVVMMFQFLGTLSAPSLLEVAIVGAIAGGAAGMATRRAAHGRVPHAASARR